MSTSVIIGSTGGLPPGTDRLTSVVWSDRVNKGQLNKSRSRLGVLGEGVESSRTAVGVVTGHKLNFAVVLLGPFQVGEPISNGLGATGVVTSVGDRHIHYTPTLGVFAITDTITGGLSFATGIVLTLTTPNIVGQIVKIPQDNVAGLKVTVQSEPAAEVLDNMEASQAVLQLAWTTLGIPAVRDTSVFREGTASLKLDATAQPGSLYTHLFTILRHGIVTGGPFQLNEPLTIGAATATVHYANTDHIHLVSAVGVVLAGDLITGTISGATALATGPVETTVDWSSAASLTFSMLVTAKQQMQLAVTISDGLNTAVQNVGASQISTWTDQVIDLQALAATGLPLPIDLTVVVSISMQPVLKKDVSIHIDRLRVLSSPGNLGVRLYDMGAVLPVGGVDTLGGSTAKLLGDLGIEGSQAALVTVPLKGGKEQIMIDSFAHGVALEIPTETLLTPGNYYAITFEFVDEDYTIFGPDPTFGIDYYPNGFAFSAPDTLTPIAALGPFVDCMFDLYTAVEVWIQRILIITDANPAGGIFELVAEDTGMNKRLIGRGPAVLSAVEFDRRVDPVYMPKGGKCELYYTDAVESSMSVVTVAAVFFYASQDNYVVAP